MGYGIPIDRRVASVDHAAFRSSEVMVTCPADGLMKRGNGMFRHAVLIKFKPTADDAYRASLAQQVNDLPNAIPEVRGVACGEDTGVTAGSSDFAIIVDLDSADDYATYESHPAHLQLVDLIRQGVESRSVVDFQF
jgi:stress responsive alpha/beta barrel protein